jgi:hypothetical protein
MPLHAVVRGASKVLNAKFALTAFQSSKTSETGVMAIGHLLSSILAIQVIRIIILIVSTIVSTTSIEMLVTNSHSRYRGQSKSVQRFA